MKNRKQLKKFFGVGPIGVIFTLVAWSAALLIEKSLSIPKISIHPILRAGLMAMFTIDALYLLIGSNVQLRKSGRGNDLLTEGPYQFIRHPIYSTWIYSFTGLLSMILYSWVIIISVIPINMFWSWLVTFEENKMLKQYGSKYQEYMNRTGQFLPSWKAMKASLDNID